MKFFALVFGFLIFAVIPMGLHAEAIQVSETDSQIMFALTVVTVDVPDSFSVADAERIARASVTPFSAPDSDFSHYGVSLLYVPRFMNSLWEETSLEALSEVFSPTAYDSPRKIWDPIQQCYKILGPTAKPGHGQFISGVRLDVTYDSPRMFLILEYGEFLYLRSEVFTFCDSDFPDEIRFEVQVPVVDTFTVPMTFDLSARPDSFSSFQFVKTIQFSYTSQRESDNLFKSLFGPGTWFGSFFNEECVETRKRVHFLKTEWSIL